LPTGLVVVLVVATVVGLLLVHAPTEAPLGDGGEKTTMTAHAHAGEPQPRCRPAVGSSSYRVGSHAASSEDAVGGGEPSRLAPFAAEAGRAAAVGSGFAVGVKYEQDGRTMAGVVTLPERGPAVHTPLGPTRGDLDAPLVTAAASGWLAAVLEPNASALGLRLVRPGIDGPVWGAEASQPADESLASDLAAGIGVVAVVWDEVTKGGERSRIMLATFRLADLGPRDEPVAVSPLGVDADGPRIVGRAGGFWLAYVARDPTELPEKPDDEALARDPQQDRYPAEKIEPSWIELLPLDATGAPVGEPRAVTGRDGHVLAFDLGRDQGGTALVAWRDDDTPSGGQGGRVQVVRAGADGTSVTQPVVDDDGGSGAPSLLAGWIALADEDGRARLAPLGGEQLLAGELRLEPAIDVGQPLAAQGDRLLVALPAGRALDLVQVSCTP
jgi:hypothetical protein